MNKLKDLKLCMKILGWSNLAKDSDGYRGYDPNGSPNALSLHSLGLNLVYEAVNRVQDAIMAIPNNIDTVVVRHDEQINTQHKIDWFVIIGDNRYTIPYTGITSQLKGECYALSRLWQVRQIRDWIVRYNTRQNPEGVKCE